MVDLANISSDNETVLKTVMTCHPITRMPILSTNDCANVDESDHDRFQNVHPLLGWYKHDLEAGILSYDKFMNLMQPANDIQLLNLLTQVGVIATDNDCFYFVVAQ